MEVTSAKRDRRSTASGLVIAVTGAVGGSLFGYDTAIIFGAILFVRGPFQLSVFQVEFAARAVPLGAHLVRCLGWN